MSSHNRRDMWAWIIPILVVVAGIIILFTRSELKLDQQINVSVSAILALLTYIYVHVTYKMLESNRQMLSEQMKSSAEQTRPFVVVSFPSQDAAVHLNISNIGNRPAVNVKIRFEPDLNNIKDKVAWGDQQNLTFSDRILSQPFLPVAASITTTFAESKRILSNLSEEEKTFRAFIEYRDLEDREYSSSYDIDLGAYIHDNKTREFTIGYRLEKIAEHLESLPKVNDILKSIDRGIDGLIPPPTHYEDGTPIEKND
jgi:hypothetical protein